MFLCSFAPLRENVFVWLKTCNLLSVILDSKCQAADNIEACCYFSRLVATIFVVTIWADSYI